MRPEPRAMTLGDAMALSVGVAVSLASPRFLGGLGFFPFLLSPTAMIVIMAVFLIWAAGMAISFAVLSRTMRYGRRAGPGEWLAFLLVAVGFVALAPNLFQSAEPSVVQATGLDYSTVRWLIAGGWTLVLVAGLASLLSAKRHLPAWMNETILVGLAVVAIGGPFTTFRAKGPFLANPVEILGQTPLGLFLLQCCELMAGTPLLLMIAVPTMALVARWPLRRSWTWTEWAGPSLCLPMLGFGFFQRPSFFPPGSGPWLADQAFGLAWLVAVLILARGIVRWWGRSPRKGEAQAPLPDSIESSPASTRAT